MNIPTRLYKYQAVTPESLSNLAQRQIWFSAPARFNDPFDCAVRLDRKPISEANFSLLYDRYRAKQANPDEFDARHSPSGSSSPLFRTEINRGIDRAFKERVQLMRHDRGVSCFSAKYDDILMWAHYTNGHRGFCLEFETHVHPFSKAKKVGYYDDLPSFEPTALILDPDRDEEFFSMITSKYRCWKYEEEWRIFHMEANKAYGYAPGALSGLYLGSDMSSGHRILLGKILHGTSTQLYQMHRDQVKFAVSAKPVTFSPTE